MIQVLPAKYNLGTAIGEAAGQGVQQGLGRAFNRQYDIGLAKQGANEANRLITEAGNDPQKLLVALSSLTAYNPAMEKAIGPLYSALSTRMQLGPGGGGMPVPGIGGGVGGINQPEGQPLPQGTGQSSTTPTNTPTVVVKNPMADLQQFASQYPGMPTPEIQPEIYGGELEPTALGMGPIPPRFTPDQILAQRNQDLAAGHPESIRANFMEKFNQDSADLYDQYVSRATQHANIARLRDEQQQRFMEALKEHTGINNPDDLAVAEAIANLPEFKNINNYNQKAKKVGDAFKEYQAGKAALEEVAQRPNYFESDYAKNMKTIPSKLEKFRKYGQMQQAREILSKGGWSESEIAKMINPLPQNLVKKMEGLPKVNRALAEHIARNPSDEKIAQEQTKMLDKWEDFLGKNIKPGITDPKNQQVVKPGTSLILLRNQALKHDIPEAQFDLMLSRLIESGKITLDNEQAREYNLLTKPAGRVKSVGEFLFGD